MLHDACHRVGGMLPGARHYETLVFFVIYFVLKMFKNILYKNKTRIFFPEQECNLVTVTVLV